MTYVCKMKNGNLITVYVDCDKPECTWAETRCMYQHEFEDCLREGIFTVMYGAPNVN